MLIQGYTAVARSGMTDDVNGFVIFLNGQEVIAAAESVVGHLGVCPMEGAIVLLFIEGLLPIGLVDLEVHDPAAMSFPVMSG